MSTSVYPEKKKKKRRVIGVVLALVYLSITAYIIISIVSGAESWGFARFANMFSQRPVYLRAGEINFNVGRNRVFADLGGSLAAAGTLGIQVLDADGNEALRESFRMESPAISAQDGRAIVYDIGGTEIRVFNGTEIVSAIEANGRIVSATINPNGWIAVATQVSGGYRGVVTVHNDRGRDVFRVFLVEEGYVLTAALSPDNGTLSVLTLRETGSMISRWEVGRAADGAQSYTSLPDELIIDISHLPNGNLLAVSTGSLIVINRNGSAREIFDFSGRRLGRYAMDSGVIILHLLDYGVGNSGRIITLRENGSVIAELEANREILSMSAAGGYLAVLWSDGLMFYDSRLNELPVPEESFSIAGANRVIAVNGAALVAGDYAAVVLARE
ncbi:MAG: DUF5711 family protein [Oscillospiraceae bacterium]|nr:DUF5711 family protein [Oscillospiraceae bacterium]